MSFNNLNNWFFNNLCHFYKSFIYYWHWNNSLDLFRDLSNKLNNSLAPFLDFLNNISINYLFFNDLNFIGLFNCICDLNYFFNNLRNLYNSFLSLNNDNWFLYNSINDYMFNFNVIFNLFGSDHITFFNNLFTNLLDLDNFRDTNDFLTYFLDNIWYLNYFLYYLFYMYDLLSNDLDLFVLNVNMINNLFDNNWFLDFNNLLNDSINILYFRNLSDQLNYSFNDSWNFDNFFNYLLYLNNLFNNSLNNNGNFDWNWNLFLHLSNLFYFNYLFYNFFNCNDLRNFN